MSEMHGRDGFLTVAECDNPYILLNSVALVQKNDFFLSTVSVV